MPATLASSGHWVVVAVEQETYAPPFLPARDMVAALVHSGICVDTRPGWEANGSASGFRSEEPADGLGHWRPDARECEEHNSAGYLLARAGQLLAERQGSPPFG
jgi:hypothetical protein